MQLPPKSFCLCFAFVLNQLVGTSALDPLYFNVVLFGNNARHCVEDKDFKEITAAPSISTSKLKHSWLRWAEKPSLWILAGWYARSDCGYRSHSSTGHSISVWIKLKNKPNEKVAFRVLFFLCILMIKSSLISVPGPEITFEYPITLKLAPLVSRGSRLFIWFICRFLYGQSQRMVFILLF